MTITFDKNNIFRNIGIHNAIMNTVMNINTNR